MPHALQFTGSNFLNVEDVHGLSDAQRMTNIDHVTVEEVNKQQKLVAYFVGIEDGLPLNTARINQLTNLHSGDDNTDNWRGTAVELYVDPSVMYSGRKVGGVAIRGRVVDPKAKPI